MFLVAFTMFWGLKTTGKIFGWGYSANGRLGIVGAGAQYFRTPQAIESSSNYKQIATSWDASAIMKSDNTLYAFGVNHNGITGGTAGDTNNLAPQQIGTSSNWKTLALRVGGFHFGAVQNDGSIWAWGANNLYQLGNGDGAAADSNVPTQVACTDNLAVNDIGGTAKISVYPNPVKDHLYIRSQQKVSDVKIYSVTGTLMKTISKIEGEAKINISDLPAGAYILKINNDVQGIKLLKK